VNAASLSTSVSSLSLPPIPQVRTPASLGVVFGGATGAFGGAAVASDGSNINPVALNLLNAKNPDGTFVIPSPQTSGSGVNYTAVVPGYYNEDQFNTNVDARGANEVRESASVTEGLAIKHTGCPLVPTRRVATEEVQVDLLTYR
jgi:hypothetical protein